VAIELGHEALAETHDFVVAFALGIKVGAALAAAMGSVVREFLKTCSKAKNFRMPALRGWKRSLLVGADGAVHLDAESAMTWIFPRSSNHGTRNMMNALGSTMRSRMRASRYQDALEHQSQRVENLLDSLVESARRDSWPSPG